MRIGKAFSVFGLADQFRHEVADLARDEVRLAKVEVAEKTAILKRNAIALGIGVFVSFAGLVIVSLSLGRLLALAFQGMGWSPELSNFVGIVTAGLVIALIGVIFLLKAIKTMSSSSLKPEKTIETLRELRGKNAATPPPPEPPAPVETKEQIEARIDHTRSELKHTMHKARKRLAWTSAAAVFGRHARRHPLRMLALGAGAGLARRAIKRRRANSVS